jgi:VanZ family protein
LRPLAWPPLDIQVPGNQVKNKPGISPRYRLQRYLAAGYALFIAYVSLSPFSGWQEQGLYFIDVLSAPLAQTFTSFDFILNFLSYLPFGFLLAYILRGRRPAVHVMLLVTLGGLCLSVSMEYAQMYLPTRISSNTDLISNTLGTFTGSAFALKIAEYSWFARIASWHDKWFQHGMISDFGLALVALWMFAQINPTLPMLGSVFVSEVARWPYDIVPAAPFNWLECTEVAFNLLLLGILLLTLMRERRYTMNALLLVLCAVTVTKFIAAAILLKSWALLLWLNSEAVLGIIIALLLLTGAIRLSRNWLFVFGALLAIFYLAQVQDQLLVGTPSVSMRMYHWHYGHMLNYNGLSQLASFLFPVLFLVYLWRTATQR